MQTRWNTNQAITVKYDLRAWHMVPNWNSVVYLWRGREWYQSGIARTTAHQACQLLVAGPHHPSTASPQSAHKFSWKSSPACQAKCLLMQMPWWVFILILLCFNPEDANSCAQHTSRRRGREARCSLPSLGLHHLSGRIYNGGHRTKGSDSHVRFVHGCRWRLAKAGGKCDGRLQSQRRHMSYPEKGILLSKYCSQVTWTS
jgi:hypothetical protein